MRRLMLAVAMLAAAALPEQALAQARKPSIEARLQRAEDELAIRRLLVDYATALETHDAEAYVALFARNGVWINGSMVRKAPDEIRALVVGMFGKRPPDFVNRESFELVSNPEIDLDGDHATVRSRHLLFRRAPDGSPLPVLSGQYEDQLIREDGKWKFLRRVDNPIMPTGAEWLAKMRARAPAK